MMKEKCKSRVTEWTAAGHALADWTNFELLGENVKAFRGIGRLCLDSQWTNASNPDGVAAQTR